MHRSAPRFLWLTVVVAAIFMLGACKSSMTKPTPPAPPSPPGAPSSSPPSPPTASKQPSKEQGEESAQSSPSEQQGGEQQQQSEQEAQAQSSEQGDKTRSDKELAEVGESVAGAADAVARAAEALARAQEKMEGESDDEADDAQIRADGDPALDPFAKPTAGSKSDAMSDAAASVAQAAESVRQAQELLKKESEEQASADTDARMNRAQKRESKAQREREQQASEDLDKSGERLEKSAKILDEDSIPADTSDEDQTAREALTKAAADLLRARAALIDAAVEMGYIPREMTEGPVPEAAFEDMETMVEFLEKSVELLATIIERGGLPDFDSPEFEQARKVMTRGGDSQQPRRQTAEIDGELDRTLADFDGELSNERRSMRRGDGEGMETVGAGSAGAGGREGEEYLPSSGSVASTADPESGGQANSGNAQRRNESSSIGGGRGAEVDVPENLPNPQGDDVVARQLREAATAEKDPELRARLWEEYRTYREATGN